jgi:hypothetical protein
VLADQRVQPRDPGRALRQPAPRQTYPEASITSTS